MLTAIAMLLVPKESQKVLVSRPPKAQTLTVEVVTWLQVKM